MSTSPPKTEAERAADFRLGRVLFNRARAEGGYSALAREISNANAAAKRELDREARRKTPAGQEPVLKQVIDRRKLKALADGDDNAVLSIAELRALDNYLQAFREGLAHRPIFEQPDLLQELAGSGRVTFLIGSRQEPDAGSFSAWDVLALAEIQRGLSALGHSVVIDVQEVPFDWEAQPKLDGEWRRFLGEQSGAVVCIASSRTNAAFEVIMGEATGCEPYAKCSVEETLGLPFAFAWKPDLKGVYPSSFHLEREHIQARAPEIAQRVADGQASALVVGNQVLEDQVTPKRSGATHGLVIAHRPKGSGLRLCITGVTGPGTLCAAKFAGALTMGIHPGSTDLHFAVVRGSVPPERKDDFLNLRDFAEHVLVPPTQWTRSEKARLLSD